MKWSAVLSNPLLAGALAGLLGGLVYGATMSELDLLPTFARLVGADSAAAGFAVLMAVAAVVGAGFGLLVSHRRPEAGETLFWGLVYGTFWWYLGPLTLQPLLQGDGLTWDLDAAKAAFPYFLGLVLYGATIGLSSILLSWGHHVQTAGQHIRRGPLLRGALAGLLGAVLLGVMLDVQDQLLAFAGMMDSDSHVLAWLVTLLVGLLAGVGYVLLYPQPTDGAGVGLIRGSAYGFLWWVVSGLTVVPLLSGASLAWFSDEVSALFVTLPAYILFGAAVVLFYQWLGAMVRLLFSDMIGGQNEEGIGTQGLRILGRSLLAGVVGGLLFSLVMLQTDFLPSVADLVGSSSEVAGFFVHLAIAVVVGTSYGLLFRRQSYDVGSALGWGVSYGFFWSILGPLTLMPLFLGSTPQWTVAAVAAAFPNLVGHLAYGVGLGITFYLLEAGYNPWWIPRTQLEAARVAHRREEVLTASPALWVLVVAIGLTLPVLLAG